MSSYELRNGFLAALDESTWGQKLACRKFIRSVLGSGCVKEKGRKKE